MKITFIEPTPSPNTMKLHLDHTIENGLRKTYTLDNELSAPPWIRDMLHIPGVKSVFHTSDFAALERKGNADWSAILGELQERLGQDGLTANWSDEDTDSAQHYGDAEVLVQYFRGIPMQIRVKAQGREERIALSNRFTLAITEVASSTMIKERKLADYGVRYGELEDIAREVEQELEAAYPEERVQQLVQQAIAHGISDEEFTEKRTLLNDQQLEEALQHEDWRIRYAALDGMTPSEQRIEIIRTALHDSKVAIRRLAIIYLGDLASPEAMKLLYVALQDKSAAVRRTAGDTLSDIGDASATEAMMDSLQDTSKIVRWRAARFLYEVGTNSAREALEAAIDDPEFEVSLQARMALERIESGEAAAGTIWQQMAGRSPS
ncbi:virulence factor [Paenibacillus sp. CMAA1364]